MRKVMLTIVIVCALNVSGVAQQRSAAPLRFEVASIKPSPDKFDVLASLPRQAAGRLFLSLRLWALIQRAYGIESVRIVGGPASLMNRSFDINAKAENPNATSAQLNEMLRSLLVERFQLEVHRETRTVDVSVLKLARADGRRGPNLKPSMLSCLTGDEILRLGEEALGKGDLAGNLLPKRDDPCGDRSPLERAHVKGQPISTLLPLLATRDRPFVEDRTGLTGRYDWDLTFDPRPLSVIADSSSPNGPSLLAAIEQQLGLKVEAAKGKVEFLVIDAVKQPTPD